MRDDNPMLEELRLNATALRELQSRGFRCVHDLRHIDDVELLRVPGIGGRTFRRIRAALGRESGTASSRPYRKGETEIPLTGGRVTAGVMRVGDTIRRPITTDRSQVHDLLSFLEAQSFEATPRFLGVDEHNREILGFIPGEVPVDLGHYTDTQLMAAATLLRRFHDATAGFELVHRSNAEVMCHNDWGPPNAVFRHDLPRGIIDFDTIKPGMRLWDLGYSAFAWLDLGNPDYKAEEQIRRLFVFADGYGLEDCPAAAIAVHTVARQIALAVSGRLQGKAEMAEWAAAAATWTVINVTERLSPTGYSM